jgi:hypothetical protein
MATVNLLAEMSDGWYYAFSETLASPALDRVGISIAVANLLKDDTSVLYGASNLLQVIEGDPKKFNKAKVDAKRNRHGLYLWASAEGEPNIRSQNADFTYSIGARFEGLDVDTTKLYGHLDDAYERCKDLINDEMYSGGYLTNYYTDTNSTVIDIRTTESDLPEPTEAERQRIVVEIESAFIIEINRIK